MRRATRWRSTGRIRRFATQRWSAAGGIPGRCAQTPDCVNAETAAAFEDRLRLRDAPPVGLEREPCASAIRGTRSNADGVLRRVQSLAEQSPRHLHRRQHRGFGKLLEPAIVTLGVFYVIVWGYLQLAGKIEETFLEGVRRLVTLALILGLSLQLWLFNEVIVDTFFSAPGGRSSPA